MKNLEWSESSLDDLAGMEKAAARRIQIAVARFAETETGNIKKLKATDPPQYRLRVGDWRVRFVMRGDKVIVVRVLNRKDAYR